MREYSIFFLVSILSVLFGYNLPWFLPWDYYMWPVLLPVIFDPYNSSFKQYPWLITGISKCISFTYKRQQWEFGSVWIVDIRMLLFEPFYPPCTITKVHTHCCGICKVYLNIYKENCSWKLSTWWQIMVAWISIQATKPVMERMNGFSQRRLISFWKSFLFHCARVIFSDTS